MDNEVTLLNGYTIEKSKFNSILTRLGDLSAEHNNGQNISDKKSSVMLTAWLASVGFPYSSEQKNVEILKDHGLLVQDGSMARDTIDVTMMTLNFDGNIQPAQNILKPQSDLKVI